MNQWYFLEKIEYLDLMKTIAFMMRKCDTNKTMLHIVYEKRDSMIEEVQRQIFEHENQLAVIKFYNKVHGVLVKRWDNSSTFPHGLSHSLDLKYYSEEWLAKELDRFLILTEKFLMEKNKHRKDICQWFPMKQKACLC